MVVGLASLVVATAVLLWGQALAGGARQSRSSLGIVFERGGSLYAIAVDGSRTARLTNTPVWDEKSPSVSPDGRWIAYSRSRGYASTLWVMSVDGRSSKRLNGRESEGTAWSPDGRTIYFARFLLQEDKGPNFQFSEACGAIFRIGVDGSGETRLTNPPWKDSFHSHFSPAVSPNGLRIAFTDANQCSGGTTSYALRVIDTTGHTTSDLGGLPGNGYPASPDYGGPTGRPTAATSRSSASRARIQPSTWRIATGMVDDVSRPRPLIPSTWNRLRRSPDREVDCLHDLRRRPRPVPHPS